MASGGATGGRRLTPLTDGERVERQKRAAARAAAEMVDDGMRLGLGTGSTVAHLLPAIAERGLSGPGLRRILAGDRSGRPAPSRSPLLEPGRARRARPRDRRRRPGRPRRLARQGRRRGTHAGEDRCRGRETLRRHRLGGEAGQRARRPRAARAAALRRPAHACSARACAYARRAEPRRRPDRRLPRPGRRSSRALDEAERHPGPDRARPVRAGDGQHDRDRLRGRDRAPPGRKQVP